MIRKRRKLMMLKIGNWTLAGLALALLSACVTIHIYFPAAAAEEAARVIVRDVLETGLEPRETPRDESEPSSRAPAPSGPTQWAGAALEYLFPPANAQSAPDLQVDTAATRRLQAAMRARHPDLSPHLRSGALGFGLDALIAIRDLSQIPLRERAAVQQLVNDENADRLALYREIARANGRPDWENDIRRTFARVWVEEAPSGYWYEISPGNWGQK
jgi:hypothetical protein